MTCEELDRFSTSFIDGECTAAEGTAITAHLRECPGCRARVDAESAARHVLQSRAAAARRVGIALPWRPRVFRLGQPALPSAPSMLLLLLVTVIGAGVAAFWLRPIRVQAVGVIGDSYCNHEHRFTTRFNVSERECTLGCVQRGAEFVLVTDTQLYRIRNQQLPELAALANHRVTVEGTLDGDRIVIASMTAADHFP